MKKTSKKSNLIDQNLGIHQNLLSSQDDLTNLKCNPSRKSV